MKVFLTRRIPGEAMKILQTSEVYAILFIIFKLSVITHVVAKAAV